MTGALEGFAVIGALIAVGYLLAATGVLEESSQVVLARLVYFVATPALLIEILGSTDLATVFGPWFLVAAIGVVAVLLVYVPWARWRGHPGKDVVVGGLASSFANSGYLGLPIAAYVAGDVAFALPTIMLQLMVMTPIAVTLLSMEDGRRVTVRGFLEAGLSNPISIAAIIGVALSLGEVDLPRFVDEPISLLGAMAIPSAVLAFGVALRFGPRIGHGNRTEVAFVTVLKLVWQPLVTYLVARHALGLDAYEVAGVTVMAALPTAQSVFVYAAQFGRGEVLARDSVVITTLVSLPVMVLLAGLLVP
ncbi:AEC family transporter [Aeromicrobium tamlense]|uniref:AEC family transporter n=1 Tax=Aeromicrobium tamlense TaxID=375541 RepID=A0A8I0KMY4_9ACTN|nr:AEC family transporter [Aeromicrobium tamlense]MBD1270204.1 AEC family transporter [Aeromicrobium tamlense]NYI39139.1 hypothetical protein [Aeromicrobium tamlense]